MEIKSTDLISIFEKSLRDISAQKLEEIGFVIQVGDFSCKIHGLTHAVYGELIEFEGGNKGIILNLDEGYVVVFLLFADIPVSELEVAKRTGGVFKIPVAQALLGRVVNALGHVIDGMLPIEHTQMRPIEVDIRGIAERTPINESLETGTLVIDALFPIGKGQRELLIGNRTTGKTSIALDAIFHQRDKNVICVYVSIGQRQANLARLVKHLEEEGALAYTVVVSADAGESALNRYLAPYSACTIAEFFRDQGRDVLIVYDDLSNHAIAYREMSLLMKRSPGREAYPGDVFYLHSRLLERAGKFLAGGSITALPIVQVQSDDITAYIPTNLISITDGQIFFDSKLFYSGVRPAVNVELSVSRVGGAAQTKAMKKVTRALRLELTQYHELLAFSQFGTELDPLSQKRLARGAIVVELLQQKQNQTYSFVDQVIMLFLLRENFLDVIDRKKIHDFVLQFVSYVRSVYPEVYADIKATQDLTSATETRLKEIAREFSKVFAPPAA
jgi:F-type H+-transporting ATPase subunit alpha